MDRYALLVGNSVYNDAKFSGLKAPQNDVSQLAAVLGQAKFGGYQVEKLRNEPEKQLRYQIEKFLQERTTSDFTLLYWSGHGFRNRGGSLCLAAVDSEHDAARSTSIDARFLRDCLSDCRSSQKIVIIDACYSGAFLTNTKSADDATAAVLREIEQARGTIILTSGSATQESWEDPARNDGSPVLSVFTRHLVEGLRTGKADRDGDGEITAQELYEYLDVRMAKEPNPQRPMHGAEGGAQGRIVVAYTGRQPRRQTPVATKAAARPRPFQPPIQGLLRAVRDGWKTGRTIWERWPAWARIASATVLAPLALVVGALGALAVGTYMLVYSGIALWERDPRLLWGAAAACTATSVVIGVVATKLFTGPPSPRLTCDYAWTTDVAAGPASVPTASGSDAYTAIIHTSLGDISITALSSSHPCAAFAFRYLAQHGFYANNQCSYFDQPTTGYILDCFDPHQTYPNVGVSFSPDGAFVPDPSDGLVLLNVAGNQSQGLLAFSGNDPSVAAGSYEPCAQITQGLDIVRKVANAGSTGGFFSDYRTARTPITIKSIVITMTPAGDRPQVPVS